MSRSDVKNLQEIPNIGKAMERDLQIIGIENPEQLIGNDPYTMYTELCNVTRNKHDPCVIDVFISAVKYMEGGPAKKWWEFTDERKNRMRGQ